MLKSRWRMRKVKVPVPVMALPSVGVAVTVYTPAFFSTSAVYGLAVVVGVPSNGVYTYVRVHWSVTSVLLAVTLMVASLGSISPP